MTADVLQALGAILAIVGLWLVWPPLAFILAGLALIVIGVAIERGSPNGPRVIDKSES